MSGLKSLTNKNKKTIVPEIKFGQTIVLIQMSSELSANLANITRHESKKLDKNIK
jgi:hypothetical protein